MDRRFYDRTHINVNSCFIIRDKELGYQEFNGMIENISEGGILIRVDSEDYGSIVDSIKEGMALSFQLLDEYELFEKSRLDIISGEAEVIRVESDDEEKTVGCKIKTLSPKLDEYIQNKRMAIYMKAIKQC